MNNNQSSFRTGEIFSMIVGILEFKFMIVGILEFKFMIVGILLGCALLCFVFVFLVLEDFDFFDDFEDFTLLSFVLSLGDFCFTFFFFL